MKKQTFLKIIQVVIPLAIIIFGIFLAWENYTPGTILSGWDTLHPEFDFPLALKRALFGVWREEQGAGALAAHSHMSELPRILFLWVSSVVLPQNFLRYFYIFLAMILGPLGVFFFIKEAQGDDNNNLFVNIFSLLSYSVASIYFLLNFENLQNFYVPLEMFVTLFAFVGWLFFLGLKSVKSGKKRYYFLFFLISLIASPMAFAATLFYSWLIVFALFLTTFSFISKNKILYFKRLLMILTLILSANSYWLLPNVYSVANQSKTIALAKINRLFTPEAFLSNQAYGNIQDVAVGRNHLFSWREFDVKNNQFVDLLDEWNSYLSGKNTISLSYLIVVLSLLGLMASIWKKDKVGIALIPVLLLTLFFLINENLPFTLIYSFLRKNISVFSEGLRMPFTKFSTLFIFVKAYYLAYFAKTLIYLLGKKTNLKALAPVILTIILLAVLKPMQPALQGNLISKSMRNNIPREYFELSKYLKGKEGRIAKLPMNTWAGWTYFDWNYEGAGFLSFILANPTLDRDFDRWSPYNESFYNEASRALYQQNPESFEKVLAKYQVGFLLLDKSIVNAGGESDLLFIPETEALLSNSEHIIKEREIGFLTIYRTDFVGVKDFVRTPHTYANIRADLAYQELDPIYQTWGDYVNTGEVYYPFINLDKRMGVSISQDESYIYFSRKFDQGIDIKKVIVPKVISEKINSQVLASIKDNNTLNLSFKNLLPKIVFDGIEKRENESIETHEFKFDNTLPDFVEINRYLLDLRNKELGNKPLGNVVLTPNKESVIKFYADKSVRQDLTVNLYKEKPRLCSDPDALLPLNLAGNGFNLEAVSSAVCIGESFRAKDAVYEFSFEAKSDSATPQFCITQNSSQKCLDSQLANAYMGESDGWKKFNFQISLTPGNSWFDFVAVGTSGNKANISFRNFEVREYTKVGEETYAFGSSFTRESKDLVFALEKSVSSLTLAIPKTAEYKEDFSLGRGNKEPVNCDVKKVGSVFKENAGNKVIYVAENGGVSCDYFDYPQLKFDSAYVLAVRGENIKGRGLKFYVFNKKTGRADLEEITPEGKYEEYYTILSSGETLRVNSHEPISDRGYTFNTETRSFGRIASENILSGLSFTPFDYDILKNVYLTTAEDTNPQVKLNNFQVTDIKKTGTYKYEIKVKRQEVEGKSEGLIVLSQGFDKGWIALENFRFPFTNIRILPHVKVNSWENGWILSDNSTIYIIFWPQYLEFLGFGLIILTLLGFCLKSRMQLTRKH